MRKGLAQFGVGLGLGKRVAVRVEGHEAVAHGPGLDRLVEDHGLVEDHHAEQVAVVLLHPREDLLHRLAAGLLGHGTHPQHNLVVLVQGQRPALLLSLLAREPVTLQHLDGLVQAPLLRAQRMDGADAPHRVGPRPVRSMGPLSAVRSRRAQRRRRRGGLGIRRARAHRGDDHLPPSTRSTTGAWQLSLVLSLAPWRAPLGRELRRPAPSTASFHALARADGAVFGGTGGTCARRATGSTSGEPARQRRNITERRGSPQQPPRSNESANRGPRRRGSTRESRSARRRAPGSRPRPGRRCRESPRSPA